MKKQLLIAAVAATMTSAAFADISLSGDAKVNYTNVDSATDTLNRNEIAHDINMHLVGKNGASSVNVDFSNVSTAANSDVVATAFEVENAYVTSAIGDVSVKMGQWNNTSDSYMSNATNSTIGTGKVTLSTTLGGVKIAYSDNEDNAQNVVVSGSVSGVSISHKMQTDTGATEDYTDTKVSGSVAGVNAMYRTKEIDGANNDLTAFELSTEFNGVTVTYADVDVEGTGTGLAMDSFLGTYSGLSQASGFGAKMAIAGNTVQVKSISTNSNASATGTDDKYTKFYVTRQLASGATFEATYTDKDAAAGATSDSETLDLELAVKF